MGGGLFGRPALGEDLLPHRGRHPGPVVADPQHRRGALGPQLHLDGGRRVQRVVDEVAQHRHHIARVDHLVGQERGGGDPQRDPTLGGDGGLAHQQRRQQRVVDPLRELLGRRAVCLGDLGDELGRLVVHPQLQQAQQGVQPVRVLVVLRPQRVEEPVRTVQLAAQLFQFGTVPQGCHRAPVAGRHPVGDQDAPAAHRQQVGAVDPARQHVGGTARQQHLVHTPPRGVRTESEQPLRLVVDQPDPAVPVEGDHPLPDPVQHRLTLVQQRGDVGEGQPVGTPLEPARHPVSGERADRERGARVQQQPPHGAHQPVAHTVVGDADRHGAHDPAVVVAQRHLAAGRAAEGAAVDAHHLVARQRAARVGRHVLADPPGLGVRPADTAVVHHHDVEGAGGPSDPVGLRLDRPGRTGRGAGEQPGETRLGRRGLGDGQRLAHRLVVQLGGERGEEQTDGEHDHTGGDGQLHQEHLGEDPTGPTDAHTALPPSAGLPRLCGTDSSG